MTISDRSISSVGIWLRSTEPSRVEGTKRRPFSKTSVRVAPSPRRSAELVPAARGLMFAVCGLLLARKDGSVFGNAPTFRRAEVLQTVRAHHRDRRRRGDSIANDAGAGDGDLCQ